MRGDKVRDETAATATRDIALRSVAQIEAAYGRSASETAALGRWLISALAAMNGGGLLVTVLLRDEIDPVAARLAVAIFGAGLLSAFVGACLRAAAALWLSASLRGASATWMGAATGDGIDEEALASVRRVRGRVRLSRFLVALVGLVSTLLLLGGGTVLWREFIAPAFAAGTEDIAEAEARNAAQPGEMADNGVTVVAENNVAPAPQAVLTPAPASTPVPASVQSKAVSKPASKPVAKVVPTSKSLAAKPEPAKPVPSRPVAVSPAPVRVQPKPQLPYAPPPVSDAPVSSPPSTAGSPSPQ
jgi:hypothetical protein